MDEDVFTFFLPFMYNDICGYIPGSSNQWLLLKCIYPGTKLVYLVPRWRLDPRFD